MRRPFLIAALAASIVLAPPVAAHPGAAPWEADGRPGRDTCATTCHFETEAKRSAGHLQLQGLPEKPEPGKSYDLVVTLRHAGMKIAGFLLGLDPAAGGGAPFKAASGEVETKDAAIRSTLVAARQKDEAKWTVTWKAPDRLPPEIVFYLSANAGNDDNSPFGDIIYLETFKVRAKP